MRNYNSLMKQLFLKTTRSQYGRPFDSKDDDVVLNNGKPIGHSRIQLAGLTFFASLGSGQRTALIHLHHDPPKADKAVRSVRVRFSQ